MNVRMLHEHYGSERKLSLDMTASQPRARHRGSATLRQFDPTTIDLQRLEVVLYVDKDNAERREIVPLC